MCEVGSFCIRKFTLVKYDDFVHQLYFNWQRANPGYYTCEQSMVWHHEKMIFYWHPALLECNVEAEISSFILYN